MQQSRTKAKTAATDSSHLTTHLRRARTHTYTHRHTYVKFLKTTSICDVDLHSRQRAIFCQLASWCCPTVVLFLLLFAMDLADIVAVVLVVAGRWCEHWCQQRVQKIFPLTPAPPNTVRPTASSASTLSAFVFATHWVSGARTASDRMAERPGFGKLTTHSFICIYGTYTIYIT